LLFDASDFMRLFFFFFSSRRRHTRSKRDWSSDVCSSDLASSVRLVSIRTSVRVSSGSSSGGSWYWSKPMGPPRRRSWRTVPIRGRSDATGRGGGGTPLGGQRSRPVLVVVDPAPSPRTLGRHDRQSARTRTRARGPHRRLPG